MSFLKQLFGGDKVQDRSKCHYCKNSFAVLQSGFSFGSSAGNFGASILRMRKGCDECGVPVCFDCSAAAADRKGMHGHCICPKCGANLD